MAVLVDTNILLRLTQKSHPQSVEALKAVNALSLAGKQLVITSQNFVEFWAVATRPGNANELNLTPEQTFVELSDFEQLFDLLPELQFTTNGFT